MPIGFVQLLKPGNIKNFIPQAPILLATMQGFLAQSPPMESNEKTLLQGLGFLRTALLVMALVNLSLPLIGMAFPLEAGGDERSFWSVAINVIAPVMAPLLVVVILFDYIMSKVRAADSSGGQRALYIAISRTELAVIALSLLFWTPYLVFKLN